MGQPIHNDGEWQAVECSSENCWCMIIMSNKPDCPHPGNPTYSDDCIITAGALRKHNAPVVSAAPNLYRACKRALDFLNLNLDSRHLVIEELQKALAKAETEDVQQS